MKSSFFNLILFMKINKFIYLIIFTNIWSSIKT